MSVCPWSNSDVVSRPRINPVSYLGINPHPNASFQCSLNIVIFLVGHFHFGGRKHALIARWSANSMTSSIPNSAVQCSAVQCSAVQCQSRTSSRSGHSKLAPGSGPKSDVCCYRPHVCSPSFTPLSTSFSDQLV